MHQRVENEKNSHFKLRFSYKQNFDGVTFKIYY